MPSPLAAVTIASNNYLALARVWAESYREHHPGAPVFLCVVDTPSLEVDYDAFPAQVLFAHELPIPAFRNFAFRYDVLELNTAVKPYLLAHLRDVHGLDRVLYFDPDILVLDRLSGLEEALDRHPLALTPHITGPLDDRRNPSERKLRMVGVYNLGFLAMRLDPSTRGFLDWWCDKLYRFCRNEPWSGLFVDQAWMDFAPAFLDDVAVLREPIYNVAYWNLPQRDVRQVGGRWQANGRPVGFFHFSGIDFTDLDQVSRHQDRVAPAGMPAVRPLFEDYRQRVEAAGHARLRRLPYGFGNFWPDGPKIPAFARTALQRLDPWGRRFADPFTRDLADNFFDYLGEPIPFPAGVASRALLALWERWPAVRQRFPDPVGRDLPAFLAWLAGEGGLDFPDEWQRTLSVAPKGLLPHDGRVVDPTPLDPRPERVRDLLAKLDLTLPGPLTPWLNDPAVDTARPRPILTRLALLIHESRPDLEAAFPEPRGRDQRAYAEWFSRHAAREAGLHPAFVEPVADSLPRFRPRHTPRPRLTFPEADSAVVAAEPSFASRGAGKELPPLAGPRGINWVGPQDGAGALGESLRGWQQLAREAGWPAADLDPTDDSWARQVGGVPLPAEGVPYAVTVVACSASEVQKTLGLVPAPRIVDGGLIGLWSWDYGWLSPELAYWSRPFDELWVPSTSVARILEPVVDLPIQVMRAWLPPLPDAAPRSELWADAGLGNGADPWVFLATFDGREADDERENLDALLAAFGALAEKEGDRVRLCLAATGARPGARRLADLGDRLAGLPAALSADPTRTPALLAAADAFVALPRADGCGHWAARAALAGKPVVASAVGAVTDWLTDETGFPVAVGPERLGRWQGSLPPTVVWHPVVPGAAEAALQAVVAAPDAARQRAERARPRLEHLHGDGAVQRFRAALARLGSRFAP